MSTSKSKTAEVVVGRYVPPPGSTATSSSVPIPVAVQPTQLRHPWKSTVRTIAQLVLALATLLPFVVAGVYDSEADYPAIVVQVLAVAGTITRVMALPQVEAFLRRFAPWLATSPRADVAPGQD